VLLDHAATLDLVDLAADQGAQLVVLPKAFVLGPRLAGVDRRCDGRRGRRVACEVDARERERAGTGVRSAPRRAASAGACGDAGGATARMARITTGPS